MTKLSKITMAALIVATILPLAAVSARADSCLGDDRCIATQNAWAAASGADKSTAYAAVLADENSKNSPQM